MAVSFEMLNSFIKIKMDNLSGQSKKTDTKTKVLFLKSQPVVTPTEALASIGFKGKKREK